MLINILYISLVLVLCYAYPSEQPIKLMGTFFKWF